MVYGEYELESRELELNDQIIRVEKVGEGSFTYRRIYLEEEQKKVLVDSHEGRIGIYPIPPVFIPQRISDHVELVFDSSILLGPNESRDVFFFMPIEIGIFLIEKNSLSLIDSFNFEKVKYALYGPAENGIICRYYKTSPSYKKPEADPFKYAIVSLKANNKTNNWISISRLVLPALDLVFYYSENSVFLGKSTMEIVSDQVAKTDCTEKPPLKDLKKALSMRDLEKKKIPGAKMLEKTKFIMEWGY
ncbi:MAG: DUF432 domain-containing protein [Candidatus Hydrothermarchaeota archaeon]